MLHLVNLIASYERSTPPNIKNNTNINNHGQDKGNKAELLFTKKKQTATLKSRRYLCVLPYVVPYVEPTVYITLLLFDVCQGPGPLLQGVGTCAGLERSRSVYSIIPSAREGGRGELCLHEVLHFSSAWLVSWRR